MLSATSYLSGQTGCTPAGVSASFFASQTFLHRTTGIHATANAGQRVQDGIGCGVMGAEMELAFRCYVIKLSRIFPACSAHARSRQPLRPVK